MDCSSGAPPVSDGRVGSLSQRRGGAEEHAGPPVHAVHYSAPWRLCERMDRSPMIRGRKFTLGSWVANFNTKVGGFIFGGFLRGIWGGAAIFGEGDADLARASTLPRERRHVDAAPSDAGRRRLLATAETVDYNQPCLRRRADFRRPRKLPITVSWILRKLMKFTMGATIALTFLFASTTQARVVRTVALTGAVAPGTSGAAFEKLTPTNFTPVLDDFGRVGFAAQLAPGGPGGVR